MDWSPDVDVGFEGFANPPLGAARPTIWELVQIMRTQAGDLGAAVERRIGRRSWVSRYGPRQFVAICSS